MYYMVTITYVILALMIPVSVAGMDTNQLDTACAHAKSGSTQLVLQLLDKNPLLINKYLNGQTILTTAAKAKHADVVFELIRRGAHVSKLSYLELWGLLTQNPQDDSARFIMALLNLARSTGRSYYLTYLKKGITGESAKKMLEYLLLPSTYSKICRTAWRYLPSAFMPAYIKNVTSKIWSFCVGHGSCAEHLLYAATLDGNANVVSQLLQNFPNEIRLSAYCRAASYATYQGGNPFLAAYILCFRFAQYDQKDPLYTFGRGAASSFLTYAKKHSQ